MVGPLLATVLEQLSNGGGAKAITVESVGEEVEQLGREYPIVIPAYFGLIIRCVLPKQNNYCIKRGVITGLHLSDLLSLLRLQSHSAHHSRVSIALRS